jgi:anti-sigma regulatory factor (Ser/Thr protein kinase)
MSRSHRPATTARDATRAFLARAAHLRAPANEENTDNVLLVVAELVANAIRHTVGPCALHLELLDGSIDVCVTDHSSQPPRPRTPSTDGAGGWGWFMIKRLATRIRIKPLPECGKTICAEIPW